MYNSLPQTESAVTSIIIVDNDHMSPFTLIEGADFTKNEGGM